MTLAEGTTAEANGNGIVVIAHECDNSITGAVFSKRALKGEAKQNTTHKKISGKCSHASGEFFYFFVRSCIR